MFKYLIPLLLCFDCLNGFHTSEIIKSRGYPLEVHGNITTDDGYVLTMHRIPNGRNVNSNSTLKRRPILLMHGSFGSAMHYVFDEPERGLAYLLADRGYDVWLGNVRSVSCSKRHRKHHVDSPEFWDFSVHEIAIYDIRAKIDYILNVTKEEKLFYAGHSQGSMMFFILCSEIPEYNSKIELFLGLSPAGYVSNMSHPLAVFMWAFDNYLYRLSKMIGMVEITLGRHFFDAFGAKLCSYKGFDELCSLMLLFFGGFNSEQFDKSIIPNFMKSFPESISVKVYFHIARMSNSEYFGRFDYGNEENVLEYGTERPPLYDLKKVDAPLGLFYAKKDWLVNSENVVRMSKEFPNVVEFYEIPNTDFNHMDFIWAKDRVPLLYEPIFKLMDKYR